MDAKMKKNLIVGGIVAAVILVGAMVFSMMSYDFTPAVANNGTQDSIAADAGTQDVEGGDVNTSSVQ